MYPSQPAVRLSIVMVGGGIAGISTAYALGKAGHSVTVLDKGDGNPNAPRAIRSGPNMTKILRQWGLEPTLERISDACERIDWYSRYMDVPLGSMVLTQDVFRDFEADWRLMEQAELWFAIKNLAEEAGVVFRFKAEVSHVDSATGYVSLQDGEHIYGDIIIGADGYSSHLRSLVTGEEERQESEAKYLILSFTVRTDILQEDHDLKALVEKPFVTLPTFSANGSTNPSSTSSSLHYPQIKKNLKQLREGILEMEAKEGSSSEAAKLLRNQYDRMRGMLLEEERAEIPSLDPEPTASSSRSSSPDSIKQPIPTRPSVARDSLLSNPTFAPYTDDPEQGYGVEPPDSHTLLQSQQFIMQEQDQQLDRLSHSISRQHNLSVQINEELDVHHGLLQELDAEVDRIEGRLGRARRKLDQVAKGAKENGSVVAIGVLIFILLILIIRFKT
ncbi:hypothetical protein CVT26_004150 [Gymnopilus dilepis]|uniref:t-SNARE coiled-coil homology domain-containing protein n=1 Tax=Gymnopilus dilepis TaxID=231916 RepID=A0A409W755_9AGAR|nr:hypothetical protein CVT26_004150 [Gymnopilus dilepis]